MRNTCVGHDMTDRSHPARFLTGRGIINVTVLGRVTRVRTVRSNTVFRVRTVRSNTVFSLINLKESSQICSENVTSIPPKSVILLISFSA